MLRRQANTAVSWRGREQQHPNQRVLEAMSLNGTSMALSIYGTRFSGKIGEQAIQLLMELKQKLGRTFLRAAGS